MGKGYNLREYKSKSKEIIVTTTINTPIGEMFAAASKKGIVMLCYFTPYNIDAKIDMIKKSFDADVIPSNSEYFNMLRTQLDEYFKKQRTSFELPMQFVGTSFQVKVWKELMLVPYGKTFTLDELASKIPELKSSKGLESPCAQNMLNIIVPCHRITRNDGSSNIYAGGDDKKQFLIKLENNQFLL